MELSKSKFNLYSSLGAAKMRKKYGLFSVEGEKSVADTIDFFEAVAIICVKGNVPDFVKICRDVYEVSVEDMRHISNLSTPSSIMAVYRMPERVEQIAPVAEDGLYIVLDGIQDPGNLGTIIRTCHWFGIYTIFATKDTVDLYNPKTIQSTMGSIRKVKVIYCDVEKLLANNSQMPVYGTFLDGKDIFKAKLDKRGFIIMGNEGKGISERLKKYVTDPLFIPPVTQDHSESLNVSVATAITIAQFQK